MSNYAERLKDAKKSKSAKNLTPEYVKFDKTGDQVVGKLAGTQAVQSSRNNQTYNQYIFETDAGAVKIAPGGNFDKEFDGRLAIGGVYAIEFLGKIEVGGGRSVNKFSVLELPVEIDEPGADEKSE